MLILIYILDIPVTSILKRVHAVFIRHSVGLCHYLVVEKAKAANTMFLELEGKLYNSGSVLA